MEFEIERVHCGYNVLKTFDDADELSSQVNNSGVLHEFD